MARPSLFLSGSLALGLCFASHVSAHGTPPDVTQIVLQQPTDAVIATTRGLLFGDPADGRWSLLCGNAFGVPEGLPYRIAVLPSGRIYVADLGGLRITDDDGCSWRPHPVLGALDITYLHQDAARPERLYVTVFGGEEGSIRASEDGGDTFRVLYRASRKEFLNSVLVAGSDPSQLYATGSTTDEVAQLFVLRSRDGGASWQRTALSFEADVMDVGLLAVNPVDPGELLLRVRYSDGWNGDGLLVSRDGGASYAEHGRFSRISTAAFAGDGATRFVTTSDGLLRASTSETAFTRVELEDRLAYATVFGDEILVGGYAVDNDKLSVRVWSSAISAPSAPLSRWMSFDEVTTPRSCPAPSRADQACLLEWIDWSREFTPAAPVAQP